MSEVMEAAGGIALPPREPNDFYATPHRCTEALLAVDPPRSQLVWEPACGDGAISGVMKRAGFDVISSDLIDRGYGSVGCDFLCQRVLLAPSVVTNPPFKLADEFVQHALNLGADYVAIFQRLAWLEGHSRHQTLWRDRPPARIHVFSKRQTLWRGDDPNAKASGGTMAFAWFVWERGRVGKPALGWI